MGNEDKGINPAWQKALDSLPPELRPLVIPIFQEWDKGVQAKFAEIRSEFDELAPYKQFVENNIDPEYAQQAVILADQLQRDPGKVIQQVNEAWDLGYVSKEDAVKLGQTSAGESTDGGDLDFGDDDILSNPKVKAMKDALDQLQSEWTATKEEEQEEQELAEFEEYLETLEKTTLEQNLPFNKTFVTAMISQGLDGDAAVKQYHQVLASAATNEDSDKEVPPAAEKQDPPKVMGGDGSTGGGTPDGSLDFGSMSSNDVNKTVANLLEQSLNNSQ